MPLLYDPDDALDALRRADARMGDLIERAGPFTMTPPPFEHPFPALLRSIVYQQLSGKAAATIFGRVRALFGDGAAPDPEGLLALPDEALRGCGVSRAKLAAARDLAAKTLDGTVPPLETLVEMDDAAIRDRLTQVRGIGPWTVEMLLIFWLGRPDVLPVTDLGVRKGFMYTYGTDDLPGPAELHAHGERWRPYRSVASWYLWRAVDLRG